MRSTLKNAINVEKSRIDNLLTAETLDENSELIDIRTGCNGTIYDSAGDAVRSQVNELKGDLNNYNKINDLIVLKNSNIIDLNNIKENAFYRIQALSESDCLNLPKDYMYDGNVWLFNSYVNHYNKNLNIYQTLISYTNMVFHERIYDKNGWSEWTKKSLCVDINCLMREIFSIKDKIYDKNGTIISKEEYTNVGILSNDGILLSKYDTWRTTDYMSILDIERIYGFGFPSDSYSCFSIYDKNFKFIRSYTGKYDICPSTIPIAKYFRASYDIYNSVNTYCAISYSYAINDTLESTIKKIMNEIHEIKNEIGYCIYDGNYNYLAIGNSITLHPINSYWWTECGMASTRKENDYYHLICNHLEQTKGNVCTYVTNFSIWETQAYDRAETFEYIKRYMSDKLDLITIQLSENVSDYATWESDYVELVSYIKQKSPNAQIILIGDFWDTNKTTVKERVAQQTNVQLASLNEIIGIESYRCGIGTIVYDEEGNVHTVEHSGVATHPGDNGMEYIANKVIELIN